MRPLESKPLEMAASAWACRCLAVCVTRRSSTCDQSGRRRTLRTHWRSRSTAPLGVERGRAAAASVGAAFAFSWLVSSFGGVAVVESSSSSLSPFPFPPIAVWKWLSEGSGTEEASGAARHRRSGGSRRRRRSGCGVGVGVGIAGLWVGVGSLGERLLRCSCIVGCLLNSELIDAEGGGGAEAARGAPIYGRGDSSWRTGLGPSG